MKGITYITEDDYMKAQGHTLATLSGPVPFEKRKLFPFKWLTNFEVNGQADLKCGVCNQDLTEGGNGRFYMAYIVFTCKDRFYASCGGDCLPPGTYNFHDQLWGNPTPITFPDHMKDKGMEYELVWDEFVRPNRFELASYTAKGVTLDFYRKKFSAHWGGGSFKDIDRATWRENRNGTLTITDRNHKVVHKITPNRAVEIANDILMNQTLQPKPGTQLTLF